MLGRVKVYLEEHILVLARKYLWKPCTDTTRVRHLVSKFRTSTSIQSGSFFFPLFIPVFLYRKSKSKLLFCTVVIEQANSCTCRCSPCGLFIFIVMFSILIRHMCSNSSKYMEVRLVDSPSNRMNCIYIYIYI